MADASQAVSVSTSWGAYSCTNVKVSGGKGDHKGYCSGSCKLTDKAKDGHGVYAQFQGVRNGLWDTSWTTSIRNNEGRGPTVYYSSKFSAPGVDSWRVRVCKSVPRAADPCSRWDAAS